MLRERLGAREGRRGKPFAPTQSLHPALSPLREKEPAMDIAYLGLTFVLLTLTFGLIQLCERV